MKGEKRMQTQVTVPIRDGYDFGVGVDLLSGAVMNQPVNAGAAVTGVEHVGGITVDFIVQRIQSTSDLEQALGIDAEASYGSPSFGAGVSARFNFAKSAKIQSSSLFMTVTATVKLPVLSINAPSLTLEAGKVVDRPDIFAQRFGNAFVRTMERGAIFIGVLRVDTSNSEESESIDSELKGSYGLFSGDAQERFSEVEKHFRSDVFVQMYHEGGPPGLKITDPTDPRELLRNANLFVESFTTNADASSVAYNVTLAPITIATGPLPPNQADLGLAQDVMRFCASRRSVLLDQLNLLQLIVDRPSRFDFSNGANLKEIATAAANTQSDLDLIAHCASAAIDSPSKAKFPKDFAAANGVTFPSAIMPEILPVGKPRSPGETTIPNFVGLTVTAASALASQKGVPIEFRHAESPDDPFGEDLELLQLGNGDTDHPHSNDQIVINFQLPPAGSDLKPGDTVGLGVELAPGVPR